MGPKGSQIPAGAGGRDSGLLGIWVGGAKLWASLRATASQLGGLEIQYSTVMEKKGTGSGQERVLEDLENPVSRPTKEGRSGPQWGKKWGPISNQSLKQDFYC